MGGGKSLSKRQRDSQKIVRDKANRKFFQTWWRRIKLTVTAVTVIMLSGGSLWLWRSGEFSRSVERAEAAFFGMTLEMGLKLQSVTLEGRHSAPMEEVREALGLQRGDPILAVSTGTLRERLEKVPRIKMAEVERLLPHGLHIRITERSPAALWQHQQKLRLVDPEGVVMEEAQASDYPHLPLIIGEGAPAQVASLLTMLQQEPELAARMQAAIRVGGRRWNIRFGGGVEAKLPERYPGAAWTKLAQMEREHKVLARAVKVIDLRLPDRVFLRLSPGIAPGEDNKGKPPAQT